MKVSDWLSKLDSHGTYDVKMLDELKEFGISPDDIPVAKYTVKEVAAQIQARGLGGEVWGEEEDRLVNGWELASALALHLVGSAPGDMMQGRGSSFRMNLEAIRNAGY